MAAGLAHESRNALQQIGACTEMLAMDLADQPETIDLIHGIQEAEARLLRLFEDVRAYSMPLRICQQPTELPELWRGVWQELMEHRKTSSSKLNEIVESVKVSCEVDSSYIRQAFYNILENALEATGDNASIELHCQDVTFNDQPALRVTVTDNGPGLSAEQIQRMFEPFYSTKTQGSGLGISIARRNIEAARRTVNRLNRG